MSSRTAAVVAALTWILLALAGCATTSKLEIIDAHTHTDFDGKPNKLSQIPMTEAEYFREWKEAGIVGAVSHGRQDGSGFVDLRAHNVIHCAGTEAKVDVRRIEEGLKKGVYGCIKIYLGYVHQYANSPHYEPAYRLAEKYGVPVVFHTGDTDTTAAKLKYADPMLIDDVAVDHPKVTFVIAHCGNPWIETAAEIAYKNPNVYLDGSAFLTGNLDHADRAHVDKYAVAPLAWIFGFLEDPSKLMFGTDWPLTDIASYVRAFKRAIPPEHWKAVFHDNAVRVFKLKER